MPTPEITRTLTRVYEISHKVPSLFEWLTLLLPIITTLVTFYLAYKLSGRSEKRKEKERLNDVKIYFLVLIENLANLLELQSTEIQEAIGRIKLMAEINLIANISEELHTNRIKIISDLDLFKICYSNSKKPSEAIKLLNNISSSLDFVSTVNNRIDETNRALHREVLLYGEKYNTVHKKIGDENAMMFIKPSINLINDKEYVKLNAILAQCSNEFTEKINNENIEKSDLSKRYIYFIKPLYNNTKIVAENQYTYDMLYNIKILNDDYTNFLFAKNNFITAYSNLATNCLNVSTSLKTIHRQLGNK